jgi:hypothetical protein
MPHPLKTLSVATILCLLVSCHEEPNDGPPLDGQCGLRGQKVWCNEDADCGNSFAGPYCDYHGRCFSTTPGFYHCAVEPGEICFPTDLVCNEAGICAVGCQSHDDCHGGYCSCSDRVFACLYRSCVDDACPTGFEEVPDYLGCAPAAETLEGNCLGVNGSCPTGYVPVGSRGCAPDAP